jgi:hypothetical protein
VWTGVYTTHTVTKWASAWKFTSCFELILDFWWQAGGHLATIDNVQEGRLAIQMGFRLGTDFEPDYGTSLWIGLNDKEIEGDWRW